MQAPSAQRRERARSVLRMGWVSTIGRGSGLQEFDMTKHMFTAMATGIALLLLRRRPLHSREVRR